MVAIYQAEPMTEHPCLNGVGKIIIRQINFLISFSKIDFRQPYYGYWNIPKIVELKS